MGTHDKVLEETVHTKSAQGNDEFPVQQPGLSESQLHHSADNQSPSQKPSILHLSHIYLSIFILFINYFLAQYDKFILSYFRSQVTSSLHINETQYALLSGYSTGIVYALLALPVAFIADYTAARVWTLSIAACWWSLCVVFQGLSHTFGQVYCARLGMGIGQAAVEALSISLISDLVTWRNVFIGNSFFYVGVYVGEAVSGQIATAFTKTDTSWQVAMRAIGICGIVVAVLLRLILREPSRRRSLVQDEEDGIAADGEMVPGMGSFPHTRERSFKAVKRDVYTTCQYLLRMHSFWLLLLSSSFRLLAGNVFGYYMPGYLSTLYPNTANLLSRYGIIVGTVGTATVLLGGLLTALFWHRTKLMPIYLTAVGGMISSIFVLLMVFSRDIADDDEQRGVRTLYGVMCGAYLTAELWLGCLFALIALLLPPAYKTFGLAIWSSVQVLMYSSGPEIIGLALRNTDPESQAYITTTRDCLAVIIVIGYWACGIGLLAAIPLLKRDLRRDFVRGKLSQRRRLAFGGFGVAVAVLVIVLFTVSLVYSV
ncbi:major facilitator superfamily domain-containing protein [Clohesyomyces aquaticus]|uniref:Major facilitator superfamily domain-containing protein n=1 Tax=Clohesyomyces aquaticus TaxID=1231657 RepID=A0A1Y1YKN8_9PLEO|nr:major facilitator superfamily domain-containing protein [Clohesyomyces aquaticus]